VREAVGGVQDGKPAPPAPKLPPLPRIPPTPEQRKAWEDRMRALPPARKAAVAYALKVRPRSAPPRRDPAPALRCTANVAAPAACWHGLHGVLAERCDGLPRQALRHARCWTARTKL